MLKTNFTYNQINPQLNRIKNEIKPEIKNQIYRFHEPVNEFTWVNAVNNMEKFLKKRPEIIQKQLTEYFGIQDVELESFVLYPNPASDHVWLKFVADHAAFMPVFIMDLKGSIYYDAQLYCFQEGENIIRLDFDLPSGVYLVKAGGKSMKMVVSR